MVCVDMELRLLTFRDGSGSASSHPGGPGRKGEEPEENRFDEPGPYRGVANGMCGGITVNSVIFLTRAET